MHAIFFPSCCIFNTSVGDKLFIGTQEIICSLATRFGDYIRVYDSNVLSSANIKDWEPQQQTGNSI